MDRQVNLRVFCIKNDVEDPATQWYDTKIVPLGVVEEMTSLVWTARYFSVGEVKILAPMTEINRSLLKCGNYVVKHDQYVDYTDTDGNVWRRGAEIVYIKYSKSENGTEQIEAHANMMGDLLNRRIVFPQIVMTGTCQQIANRLFTRNYGSFANIDRMGFIHGNGANDEGGIVQEDLGGSSVDYSNEEYVYLGDEIKSVCQLGKIGFDVLVCERLGELNFWLYKGRDLTDGNTDGNAPCVFSRDFDNVSSQEYEESIENYKSKAWTAHTTSSGEVQMSCTCNDPNYTDEDDPSGYDGRDVAFTFRESFVDCSDIQRTAEQSDGTTKTMTEAEYTKTIKNRLRTELSQRIETYSFNSTINVRSNLRYKEDFDLGDRVTCIEKSWGVTINSRITEITQTYEAGKNTIEVTFGESSPTLLDKIKQIKR